MGDSQLNKLYTVNGSILKTGCIVQDIELKKGSIVIRSHFEEVHMMRECWLRKGRLMLGSV